VGDTPDEGMHGFIGSTT